jgi:hypothetical protein
LPLDSIGAARVRLLRATHDESTLKPGVGDSQLVS